mmetsp:Transcript_16746/g.43044  ORF Transcript_16746/g.43044 Transcript_16746/m.43044 type:complete len:87 (-) Transcript_16746:536-796(-)
MRRTILLRLQTSATWRATLGVAMLAEAPQVLRVPPPVEASVPRSSRGFLRSGLPVEMHAEGASAPQREAWPFPSRDPVCAGGASAA